MHRTRPMALVCAVAVFVCASVVTAIAQDGGSPPPAGKPKASAPAESSSATSTKQQSHAQDFLIRGTVFTDQGMAFPGVELKIKRAGESKFRWQTYSNSRGEFAVRVPQRAEYELVVHTKGFVEQSRSIDAKEGDLAEGVVFRMQPVGGKR